MQRQWPPVAASVADDDVAAELTQLVGERHFLYYAFEVLQLVTYLNNLSIGRPIMKEADLVNTAVLRNEPTEPIGLAVRDLPLVETVQLVRFV